MIPPHELKKRDFTRIVRGYNPVEVDEHINFIIEKYTELYRENEELERKLKVATNRLDTFSHDEESIRSALVNAQRASAKITTEANERAEVIVRSAKTSCDRIIGEFREQIEREKNTLLALHQCTEDYKAKLLSGYQKHLETMDGIAPEINIEEYNLPDDIFTARIVQGIKDDVEDYVSLRNSQKQNPPAPSPAPEQTVTEAPKQAPIGRVEPIEEVDPVQPVISGSATPKMIYRVKSVKETIKQLNKTITGKEGEKPSGQDELAEMENMIGGDTPSESRKPLSTEEEFNLVYSTPENYGEEIKKTENQK